MQKTKRHDNDGEAKNVYHNYIVPCFAYNDDETVECSEKIVSFKFSGNDLVIVATHPAFNVSIKSDCSRQRIEFLCDNLPSSISCLVFLFETFIDFDERRLSHICAPIVCCHYLSDVLYEDLTNMIRILVNITIQSYKVKSDFLQYVNSLDKRIDGVEFCGLFSITTKAKQPFCGNSMQILKKQITRICVRLKSFKILDGQIQLCLQQATDEKQLEEQKKKHHLTELTPLIVIVFDETFPIFIVCDVILICGQLILCYNGEYIVAIFALRKRSRFMMEKHIRVYSS